MPALVIVRALRVLVLLPLMLKNPFAAMAVEPEPLMVPPDQA